MQSDRSNQFRFSLFCETNQDIWAQKSREAEETIAQLFLDGKPLYDIYEYARKLRMEVAEKLNHDEKAKATCLLDTEKKFGFIRTHLPYGKRAKDVYNADSFAAAAPNPVALSSMREIILEQTYSFKSTEPKKEYLPWHEDLSKDFCSIHSEDTVTLYSKISYEYSTSSYDSAHAHLITYITSNSNDVCIAYYYPDMNTEIYKSTLNKLDQQIISQLRNPTCKSEEEVLYQIGLLVYDLSRSPLLKRGSSAVNEWILRGIAKAKGLDHATKIPGSIAIRDLPFDIYAQIQMNKENYVNDFVKSMSLACRPTPRSCM